MKTMVKVVQGFCNKVTTAWKQPAVTVTTIPTPGAWLIHLTEIKRSIGALGYHTIEGGIPTAYVSLKAVNGKLWGKYYKPLVIKGKTIRSATYSAGIVSVICHEVAEMLCDPAIATLSSKDSKGRQWLVEVCDHCYGSYDLVTVDGNVCIIPDVTTPAFYDLKAKGPYTLYNAIAAPFTMTAKGYGYYKDASGKLIKL
ncbi:hypothetical protein UFOVP27_125 [uncultured Caudovirales phage]|uniref:Uncharacterized protein n=1 Tax=uncultured Caudovirales phage TaxID=2100421 RepID=A0A6J5KQ96_9CAUD|nr:hypothetical protein UFOVP27_125 [uncultured Caudovirales phage]